MNYRQNAGILAAAFGALLMLSACGDGTQSAQDSDAEAGLIVLNRGNGGEPKSIDPHFIQGTWETNIDLDLFTGLTVYDSAADPIPGSATEWETTEDGLIWTFHLRDQLWSDGTPVTANDFVFAWRRLLDPATAVQYASMLYVVKNARPINAGDMPLSELGVTAPDDRTLIVELEHPAPFLPELLTHQTAFPLPQHTIEQHGIAWTRPENFVGNGAYVLREWIQNDHVSLVKNPTFYDAENVTIDVVNYYPSIDYNAGLQRFRAKEFDIQDRFPSQQIDWMRENIPEAIQSVPYLGLYYIAINFEREALQDVRVREALNLAYDRETVTENIIRLGEPPAYSIVPPNIANYPGGANMYFRGMTHPERIARAQELMREAGYGPDNPLSLNYLATTNTDTRRLSPVIQAMWREIYVDIDVFESDVQIVYERLREGDYDLGFAGWIGDYDDAYNFLGILLN
ncbi:MAG: peptide ABC transporter substrate-binding protein, partial [Alphaproteobacteria bacterium]